jgi:hypothetical protein
MRYRFVPFEEDQLRVSTRGYLYSIALRTGPEIRPAQEIISWHWHPQGSSPHKEPHLHNGSAILMPDGVLGARAHIPTGRVSFEEVVRTLIQEMGVRPTRETWQVDLAESEGIHKLYRMWHSTVPDEVLRDDDPGPGG